MLEYGLGWTTSEQIFQNLAPHVLFGAFWYEKQHPKIFLKKNYV